MARMTARPGPCSAAMNLRLPEAHPVFARGGAFHGQRAGDEALAEGFAAFHLGRVRDIAEQLDVEVAVADMADDRAEDAVRRHVLLGRDHAFGKPRDRHADIGREGIFAGHHGLGRIERVMARLPQPVAVLLPFRPGERPAPNSSAIARNSSDLLRGTGLGAVELHEQVRLLREVELRIGVAGADLQGIDELDAGDGDRRLDGEDGGVAGGLDRGKGNDAGEDRFRDRVQSAGPLR